MPKNDLPPHMEEQEKEKVAQKRKAGDDDNISQEGPSKKQRTIYHFYNTQNPIPPQQEGDKMYNTGDRLPPHGTEQDT